MNFRLLGSLVILLVASFVTTRAATTSDSLSVLFERYHDFVQAQAPEWATFNGDHRFDAMLTDYSEAARRDREKQLRRFIDEASAFASDRLTAEDKLNRELFVSELQKSLDGSKFRGWLIPLNQQGGVHLDFPQLAEHTRFAADSDKANYLTRLRAFPHQVAQIITCMKEGVKAKIVPPKVIMERVDAQLQSLVQQKVDELDLYRIPLGIKNTAGSTSVETVTSTPVDATKMTELPQPNVKFEAELRVAVAGVMTAFKTLASYVHDQYLPRCRPEVGVWAMPDGIERYENSLHDHCSLPLSADEVYNTGLKEVERIAGQMEKIKKKLKFNGSLQEFNNHLRTGEEFHFNSKEQLLERFGQLLAEAKSHLPRMFGRLPITPCEVKELESLRSPSAPQAYYYAAPDDGSKPAYFMVNTYNLPARPIYTMAALTLHESVPGHHLQIALAQEHKDMPWFRRNMSVTGFVEGWALYAERLGSDMGLYDDLYQRYGALGFEMWRACRLVVDVGIHTKKWSREQAIEYMMKYMVNSEADIVSEVERYISWPGQACAYKIGQLKILELRARAEGALKEKFKLSDFHDILLANGAIPLPLLENIVNQWIQKQL